MVVISYKKVREFGRVYPHFFEAADNWYTMDKGEANLSESELNKILEMALAAQAYEKEHYYIGPPRTQEGKNELRAYERKLLEKTPASLS